MKSVWFSYGWKKHYHFLFFFSEYPHCFLSSRGRGFASGTLLCSITQSWRYRVHLKQSKHLQTYRRRICREIHESTGLGVVSEREHGILNVGSELDHSWICNIYYVIQASDFQDVKNLASRVKCSQCTRHGIREGFCILIRNEGLRTGQKGATRVFTALWNYRKVTLARAAVLHADLGTGALGNCCPEERPWKQSSVSYWGAEHMRENRERIQEAQELIRGRDGRAQLLLLFLRHLSWGMLSLLFYRQEVHTCWGWIGTKVSSDCLCPDIQNEGNVLQTVPHPNKGYSEGAEMLTRYSFSSQALIWIKHVHKIAGEFQTQ